MIKKTKASQLIKNSFSDDFFDDIHKSQILLLMEVAMKVGYDSAVKMSSIRQDSLIKQWFEDEIPESNTESLCHS